MADVEQQDKAIRKMMIAMVAVALKTAREAYEQVRSQAISDAEWSAQGPPWIRNWDECVELYKVIIESEKLMRKSYEDYLKSK